MPDGRKSGRQQTRFMDVGKEEMQRVVVKEVDAGHRMNLHGCCGSSYREQPKDTTADTKDTKASLLCQKYSLHCPTAVTTPAKRT